LEFGGRGVLFVTAGGEGIGFLQEGCGGVVLLLWLLFIGEWDECRLRGSFRHGKDIVDDLIPVGGLE
jgi:hypothetical protein